MGFYDWIIAVVIVTLWNGFLVWRMYNEKKNDDGEEK